VQRRDERNLGTQRRVVEKRFGLFRTGAPALAFAKRATIEETWLYESPCRRGTIPSHRLNS
jgi:hypothetical protein